MNCDALAAALEGSLLHDRDPQWLYEARLHSEQCPGCARLLELHQVEERLTELPGIEPSSGFLVAVMDRVAQQQPVPASSFEEIWLERLRYPLFLLGALMLAIVFVFPITGQSWFANILPSAGLVRTPVVSAYLSQHPPWAILLAAVSAVLVMLGMTMPEPPIRENVFN